MDGEQTDALFARADRAIGESHRLRVEVRNGLDRATAESARMMRSLEALRAQPCEPWSMAPLRAARPAEIIQREDAELRKTWRQALPLIETPLDLFRR